MIHMFGFHFVSCILVLESLVNQINLSPGSFSPKKKVTNMHKRSFWFATNLIYGFYMKMFLLFVRCLILWCMPTVTWDADIDSLFALVVDPMNMSYLVLFML